MALQHTQLSTTSAVRFPVDVMLVDGRPDEPLVVTTAAVKWAPHQKYSFAIDGIDLLLELAKIASVDELPHVIVMNRNLTRLDGLRVLCELRGHPVLWQIPVIILDEDANAATEIDCYRRGARWVQQWPRTISELISLFERIDDFAASTLSYHPCSWMDMSVFNQEYADEIEQMLMPTPRDLRSSASPNWYVEAA